MPPPFIEREAITTLQNIEKRLRHLESLPKASGGSTVQGIEVPPTTTAWRDLVVPDTVGDGTGALAQNITGSNGITYYIDWSDNSQLAAGSLAPPTATWAIAIARIVDTIGTDNVRLQVSPQLAEDPPTIDVFGMKPSTVGATQDLILPIGTNQTWAFKSFGPGGSFLSQTWQIYIIGYIV